MSEASRRAPGEVLNDRYEVLRLVGQGGMGAVYLVRDRQEGREVALKSFPPAARRIEDLAHFEHEFLTLSRLGHPNVARVYDFGVIEGTQDVFFTSEFIDGRELGEVSEGSSEADLADLIVQVCRGLEYVHSREIVHYDVKPTNVLVTRAPGGEPLVKLIDFGLAAERVDDALGVIKGTVSYLAPELARQLPVDHRADLYSLGVTIFQCVTGKLPFSGETNLDVVRRVVSEEPPDPQALRPDLSDGLRLLILRLLAKDPGARYQDANEVIRALGKLYGRDYAVEPHEAALNFVFSGGFTGRTRELGALTGEFERIFSWREADDPLASLPPPTATTRARRTQRIDDSSSGSATGFVLDLGSDELDPFDLRALGLNGLDDSGEAPRPGALPFPEDSAELDAALTADRADAPAPADSEAPLHHVVLVSGERGLGKSRLLRELKTYAQLRRVAVVEGHAGQGTYAAFVEVFRDLLGLWPGEEGAPLQPRQRDPLRRRLVQRYGAELVRLIPELDASFLPVAPRAALDPAEEELRLLDALAQFLIGYSRSRPLMVLLHDLDQADLETLELLRWLCRNLSLAESARALSRRGGAPQPPLRLLVVGTYRATEAADGPQGGVLDELSAERVVERLPLAPLEEPEVYALLESMLGAGSDPRTLARRIYRETKGNPFFIVELMRSLVESGTLKRRDGRWEIDWEQADAHGLPDTVAKVLLARAGRTTPEEREPLEVLAVLGRGATVHELAALMEQGARELVARLSALERRQVLFSELRGDARRYDFVHDIARDAIYREMDPARRVALHQRSGEHLERRAELAAGTVEAAELVRHFEAAGDRKRALAYGIRAADEARAVHANHKAIGFYTGALALLPAGSGRWRDLLQRTADLLALTGDYEQAAAAYRRLLAPELAGALTPVERVRATRRLGQVLERRGDLDGALEALSQGAFAAGRDGLEREAAALFAATASVYLETGHYQDAIAWCEVGLAQTVGLSEGEEAAQVRTVLGRSRLALGALREAEREFERCLAIRRRMGDEHGTAQALGDLGLVALESGQLDEAVSRFERALERETALGHVGGVAAAARRLAQACLRRCEYERAAALLRRALAIHQKTGDRVEVARTSLQLGRTHLALGEYEETRAELTRAFEASEALGLRAEAARALAAEARMHLQLGDARTAAARATEALRRASLHGDVPRARAAALECLGRALQLEGELDQAEELLTEAQALFRKQEDAAGVMRTALAFLRILLARGAHELARGTLAELSEPAAEQALADTERGQLWLARVDVAVACQDELSSRELGLLERAAALAERTQDRELAWRVAAARGRVLDRLGNEEGALESFVEAMTGIRRLLETIPRERRPGYLEQPDCLACKRDFTRLRARVAER